jgi:hypothetical protein
MKCVFFSQPHAAAIPKEAEPDSGKHHVRGDANTFSVAVHRQRARRDLVVVMCAPDSRPAPVNKY